MSLLLQALQKAAKNREASTPPVEPSAPSPPVPEPVEMVFPSLFALDSTADGRPREPELALEEEDLFEPEQVAAESDERFEPFAPSAELSGRAAAILRANDNPTVGLFDRVRDRPVHAFVVLAATFATLYGTYVYLQVAHPALLRGEFFSKPVTATKPPSLPPTTRPITPAASKALASAPAGSLESPQTTTTAPPSPTPAPRPDTMSAPTAPRTAAPTALAATPAPIIAAPGETQEPRAAPGRSEIAELPRASSRASARPGFGEPPLPAIRGLPPRNPRRVKAPPVMAVQTMEQQISSNPAQTMTAQLAPGIGEAYQALQEGGLDKAEALYRSVLQADAQNLDAMLGLAAIAMQRGNGQQAIGFYESALALEPRNPVAQAGLITLIGQADPQMSETRLKQLIAREPSAFLHFILGNVYAQQNQWPAAQQAYFQAYEMQPSNADYAYNLAIGLEHLGQPKLALTYYRKAIELSFQKGRVNFDQKRVIERIGQLSAQID